MTEAEPINDRDHVRGAKSPLLHVIEYGDFDCPHTGAAQAIVDPMMQESNDIAWAFRPIPLREIHPNAELIARIAEAAHRQGQFWPMHDHLMRHRAPIDERGRRCRHECPPARRERRGDCRVDRAPRHEWPSERRDQHSDVLLRRRPLCGSLRPRDTARAACGSTPTVRRGPLVNQSESGARVPLP